MLNLSEAQLGYIAGLIDGEGSIECQKDTSNPRRKNPRFATRLSFTMTTEEPLKTICGWLGVQVKRYTTKDLRRRDTFRAHIPKIVAIPLLTECLPYLILKREQATLILGIEKIREAHSPDIRHEGFPVFQPMPETALAEMDDLHSQFRELKRVGRLAA